MDINDHYNWYRLDQYPTITMFQWEFQDPKMEVLYHIRSYFLGIFPYIGLIYGRYLHFKILKWQLNVPNHQPVMGIPSIDPG
jgi:hypothetical protein